MDEFTKELANLLDIKTANRKEEEVKSGIIHAIKKLKKDSIKLSWMEYPDDMGR